MQKIAEQLKQISIQTKDVRIKHFEYKQTKILSFKFTDQIYPSLPIKARGLFINQDTKEILIRGYDKFYNIGENGLDWEKLQETVGPYKVTLKENGCIIYVSVLNNELLVTSKHSLGPARNLSHSEYGQQMLEKTVKDIHGLVEYLSANNLTAVFELADDDFEEHVLEYPPEKRGLYCHGLNRNTIRFESLDIKIVKEFADRFGFFSVDYLEFSDISKVKEFADECAKTGSFEGKAIEGFVVRCFQRQSLEQQMENLMKETSPFFFKIKFDQPYLMFREWREVTKSLLQGQHRSKVKFELSKTYMDWVYKTMRSQPQVFQGFMENKGIIKTRNLFLKEVKGLDSFVGITVSDLCQEASGDYELSVKSGSIKDKVLLIPIAVIGAGKTTLARTLVNLYDEIGHIQNDNIIQKKSAPVFEQNIMNEFMTKRIVFADRNNHLFQHRLGLCKKFKMEYPDGAVVALNYNIDSMDKKQVIEISSKRVQERGENHQCITPTKTPDFPRIISGFVHKRDPLDLTNPNDALIDRVIELNINNSVNENVLLISKELELNQCSVDDIESALSKALNQVETVSKVVKKKIPRYYGIEIDVPLLPILEEILADDYSLYESFIQQYKEKGWHSTIALRTVPDHHQLIKEYDLKYQDFESFERMVEIKLDRLVWNDKVMAFSIVSTYPVIQSANKHMHITCAVMNGKAMDSNGMLKEYFEEGKGKAIPVDLTIKGHIKAYLY
ncbi:hypothetical protein HK103_004656 [Boothiomyces macroporosus]|uniref:tRNA ligase n=1 Tax=Boothiomyces macroporosus TaxID=261099 RepID=A0AAD5Y8A6_9FUNG|nr:hypothetical protein HK103_004656 [Boothiomyces macroporosus]